MEELRIVTWSYHFLQINTIVNYLKLYNYLQKGTVTLTLNNQRKGGMP